MKRVLTLVLGVLLLTTVSPTGQARAQDDCAPSSRSAVTGVPVVVVHGWRSSAGAMEETARLLGEQLGKAYTLLTFNYSSAATVWPTEATASCLAQYVVAAWDAGGRKEKVVVVAHSMGGIATRFAAQDPGGDLRIRVGGEAHTVKEALAGLVSLATPHRGSPLGGTPVSALMEADLSQILPADDSTAGTCLALPERRRGDCDDPPYVGAGIGVAQIGTQITLSRTMFGLRYVLDDDGIPIWGDGIVPVESSTGYVGSDSENDTPRGRYTDTVIDCDYTTDQGYKASGVVGKIRKGTRLLGPRLFEVGEAVASRITVENFKANRVLPDTLLLTGLAAASPCFHVAFGPNKIGVPREPRVIKAAADAVRKARVSSPSVTNVVAVKPVDSTGRALPGWQVENGSISVDCGYGSPAAVNNAIHTCSPSAALADACWAEPGGVSVLCLQSPFEKTLARFTATKAGFEVEADPNPTPLGLELVDGSQCRLRNGGSWSSRPEPDSYGAYSCEAAPGTFIALWGTRGRPEIDKRSSTWTVEKGTTTGPLQTVAVKTAYFVATAT